MTVLGLASRATRPAKTASINVDLLHTVLQPTQLLLVTFESEKRMQAYRRSLYSINRQGMFRYRSLRDEEHMWGLVIWRMK